MSEGAPFHLLWMSHPPHSTVHLSEALRLSAMATALGSPVRMLFVGEGVRALVRGPEPYLYGPPLDRLLAGIVTPEAPVLVHGPSLTFRRWSRGSLLPQLPLEVVDDEGAAEWIYRAKKVVPF